MNRIRLKGIRDIRAMWGRALLISFIVATGIGIFIGIESAVDSFIHTRDALFQRLELADIEVVTQPLAVEEIPDWPKLSGIALWEKRLVHRGHIRLPSGKDLAAVVYYLDPEEQPALDKLWITAGEYLKTDSDQILIEGGLHQYHSYRVGDLLRLESRGGSYEFPIGGIAVSPEFLIGTVDPDLFIPLKGTLGVLYLSIKRVEEFFGYPLYNSFLFRLEEGADVEEMKRAIVQSLEGIPIHHLLSKDQLLSYRHLNDDERAIGSIAHVIVFIFSLVAFFATFLSIHRLIQSQRNEIGALRALGFGNRPIIGSYMLIALSLAIGGIVLGVPISFVVRNLFTEVYVESHGLVAVYPVMLVETLLKGAVIGTAVIFSAVLLPLLILLREEPQDLLRARSSLSVTRTLHLWRLIERVFQRFSAPLRLGIRNLWRHPGLTLTTVVSIAFSIAAGIAFSIGDRSIYRFSDEILGRNRWDMMVDFNEMIPLEEYRSLQELPVVERLEPYLRGYVEISHGEEVLGQRLMGVVPDSDLSAYDLIEGEELHSDREILLNRNAMEELGISVGDSVSVKGPRGEERYTIAGVMTNVAAHTAFVALGEAQQLLVGEEEKASGAFLKTRAPLEESLQAVYSVGVVGGVLTKKEVGQGLDEFKEEMGRMVRLSGWVSVGVALLFIFSMLMLGAFEREAEYATLQTLGFGRQEHWRILFVELGVQQVIGLALCIPLALMIGSFFVQRLNEAWGMNLQPMPQIGDFLFLFVPAVVAIPLATIPVWVFLSRIDLVQAIRLKTLG